MIKAIVFDLDGVLINSEPLHVEAWRRFFKKEGRSISDEKLAAAVGLFDGEVVRLWFGRELPDDEVDRIVRAKFDEFHHLLWEHFETFPGVRECVKALAREFRLAIASSEWRASIELVTGKLGIKKYFQAACGKEDVTRHKPHPEIYLKLARLLGLKPAECAAIEDSPAGVASAKTAGLKCIGITNSFPAEKLKDAGADLVIDSLENTEELLASLKRM